MNSFMAGLLTGIIPTIVLFFVLPILEVPRAKFVAWAKHKMGHTREVPPDIKEQLRMLEQEIAPHLRKVMSIPANPDQDSMKIREALEDIDTKTDNLTCPGVSELREKLARFARYSHGINVNTNLLIPPFKFMPEEAGELAKDIRKFVNETITFYTEKKGK